MPCSIRQAQGGVHTCPSTHALGAGLPDSGRDRRLRLCLTAILSIHTTDDEIHPIAFHSRSFNPAELNYDTHDKELLTIFEAFKHWCQYLEGSGNLVDVVTDHKNLEYFATTKLLTRRQARWSEFLSQFNMVICFRPGKLGAKPDALTR